MVGRVARGVDHTQGGGLAQHNALAMGQLGLWRKAGVLPHGVGSAAAKYRRARGLAQGGGQGRMVVVRVRHQNAVDAPRRCTLQRMQMRLNVRAGVDHRPGVGLWAPHQIAVGARPGHRPRIGGRDAPHARRQLHWHTRHQLGTDVGFDTVGVEFSDFGVGQFVGQHHVPLATQERHARHHQRDVGLRFGLLKSLLGRREFGKVLQCAPRHGHQRQAAVRGQRRSRCGPAQAGGFSAVHLGLQAFWRQHAKEACIKALGHARWCEPVAVISQTTHVKSNVKGAAQLGQSGLACVQARTPGEQLRVLRNTVKGGAIGAAGHQHANLLKTLAQRGHGVIETTPCQAQFGAELGVICTHAPCVRSAVAWVHHAPGEHGRAAAVVASALCPNDHQDFEAARWPCAVAQQKH